MSIRNEVFCGRQRSASPGLGLLRFLRQRARRRKNLAELGALDACRLEDIGLSETARARIIG